MSDMSDTWAAAGTGRPNGKSATAFRTISEVSAELDIPQHVLRFWETKFSQVKPLKRAGGRRYYRPEDVMLLRTIRDLLYRDGFTIKGAQKLLREGGGKSRVTPPSPGTEGTGADEAAPPVAAGLHEVAAALHQVVAAPSAPIDPAPRPTVTATALSVDRALLEVVLDELVTLRDWLHKRLG